MRSINVKEARLLKARARDRYRYTFCKQVTGWLADFKTCSDAHSDTGIYSAYNKHQSNFKASASSRLLPARIKDSHTAWSRKRIIYMWVRWSRRSTMRLRSCWMDMMNSHVCTVLASVSFIISAQAECDCCTTRNTIDPLWEPRLPQPRRFVPSPSAAVPLCRGCLRAASACY